MGNRRSETSVTHSRHAGTPRRRKSSMPWQERSVMSERLECCAVARAGTVPLAELCRRVGISRKTGYKWLVREAAGESLTDRSRRPQTSPAQTDPTASAMVDSAIGTPSSA